MLMLTMLIRRKKRHGLTGSMEGRKARGGPVVGAMYEQDEAS